MLSDNENKYNAAAAVPRSGKLGDDGSPITRDTYAHTHTSVSCRFEKCEEV